MFLLNINSINNPYLLVYHLNTRVRELLSVLYMNYFIKFKILTHSKNKLMISFMV